MKQSWEAWMDTADAPAEEMVLPDPELWSPSETPRPILFSTTRDFESRPGVDWRESAANLRALMNYHHLPEPSRLVLAGQVHGTRIGEVAEDLEDTPGLDADAQTQSFLVPEVDGLWTAEPGTALVIRTADCLPIVLWDGERKLLGAVHAGWRGSLGGITGELVRTLLRAGARPDRLEGWIGPRIGVENYEVSEALVRQFIETWGHLGMFTQGRMLDLPRLNQMLASSAGTMAGSIADSGLCTIGSGWQFPSHRREGWRRGRIYTIAYFPIGG